MVREAVIVDSVRTGLTKAHRGSFNMTHPVDYLAHTLGSVVDRVPNLDSAEVGDVLTGCAPPEGSQGMNMSRIAAMAAGFPKEIAGTTVNRFCSSGSQAVMMAAHQVINEGVDVAIGAGVETITMMQDGTQHTTRMVHEGAKDRFPGLYYPMGACSSGRVLAAQSAALRRRRRQRVDRRGDRSHEGDAPGSEEGRRSLRGAVHR